MEWNTAGALCGYLCPNELDTVFLPIYCISLGIKDIRHNDMILFNYKRLKMASQGLLFSPPPLLLVSLLSIVAIFPFYSGIIRIICHRYGKIGHKCLSYEEERRFYPGNRTRDRHSEQEAMKTESGQMIGVDNEEDVPNEKRRLITG